MSHRRNPVETFVSTWVTRCPFREGGTTMGCQLYLANFTEWVPDVTAERVGLTIGGVPFLSVFHGGSRLLYLLIVAVFVYLSV